MPPELVYSAQMKTRNHEDGCGVSRHVEQREKCKRTAVNKFIGWCVFLTSAYGLIGKDAGFHEQRRGFNSHCAHFSFLQDRVSLTFAHSDLLCRILSMLWNLYGVSVPSFVCRRL